LGKTSVEGGCPLDRAFPCDDKAAELLEPIVHGLNTVPIAGGVSGCVARLWTLPSAGLINDAPLVEEPVISVFDTKHAAASPPRRFGIGISGAGNCPAPEFPPVSATLLPAAVAVVPTAGAVSGVGMALPPAPAPTTVAALGSFLIPRISIHPWKHGPLDILPTSTLPPIEPPALNDVA
jgi:hypothetical protein